MRKNNGTFAWICGAAAVLMGAGAMLALDADKNKLNLVVGTYGENVYLYLFDCRSLEFEKKTSCEALNASYALGCFNGTEVNVYTVSEAGENSGACSFSTSEGKGLEIISDKRQTGADPCFVLLHEDSMMTADYSGGTVSVFPIDNNGFIEDCCAQIAFSGNGPVESRQESSHIHQLKVMPGNDRMLLASDLGADKIRLLAISETDAMLSHVSDIDCPAGSGPRHMEFSRDGSKLYCIAELSGEVLVYDMEQGSELQFKLIQRIMADEVNAAGSADIHMHPNGKYLYTSHRLDNDGIAVFSVKEDGRLEKISYAHTARHPRNFMITPDGSLLLVACRDDRIVQVFGINDDGSLRLTDSVLRFEKDMPSSITVLR